MAELDDFASGVEDDLDVISVEDRLQATAFAQQCAREWDEQDRLSRVEHITTEILEVVESTGAGALSTWTAGDRSFPMGSLANYLVGGAAKIGSILNPDHRALRIACRSGKSLLHSQLAITARRVITEVL